MKLTNEHTVTWDDIVNACIMDNCKSIMELRRVVKNAE